NQLGISHFAQFFEREGFRPVHQPGHLQPVGCQVDLRMPVMLRGEELIFWSERAVDLANVERPAIGRRREVHVRRQVRERNDRLALCERWKRPFRYAQEAEAAQAGKRQTPLQNLTTRLIRAHMCSSPFNVRTRLTPSSCVYPENRTSAGCWA